MRPTTNFLLVLFIEIIFIAGETDDSNYQLPIKVAVAPTVRRTCMCNGGEG